MIDYKNMNLWCIFPMPARDNVHLITRSLLFFNSLGMSLFAFLCNFTTIGTILPAKSDSDVMFVYKVIWDL